MSTIQSIERAFAILDGIAAHTNSVGVTALAKQVGLPKSTVSRILATLEHLEVVAKAEVAQGYQIGERLIRISVQAPYTQYLATLARPFMEQLVEKSGEAVALCTVEGDQVRYLDQVMSQHHLQVRDWTDMLFPVHVTSVGKVFLAQRSRRALAHYLAKPLTRFTANTITDPEVLRVQLQQVDDVGYALACEEFEEGIKGMAAPIYNEHGEVAAALNIFGPKFRFEPESVEIAMINELLTTCEQLSEIVSGATV